MMLGVTQLLLLLLLCTWLDDASSFTLERIQPRRVLQRKFQATSSSFVLLNAVNTPEEGRTTEQQPTAVVVNDPSPPPTIPISPPPQTQQLLTQRQKCVKGVTPRTGPLNEAVSRIANVSLEQANELIQIGAVWARMERLTADDLLAQYYDDHGQDNDEYDDDQYKNDKSAPLSSANSRMLYADLPSRMIRDPKSSTHSDDNSHHSHHDVAEEEEEEGESLDAYIDRIESQRFRRILSPSFMEAGTDLRIYPEPRRFPSCYEITRDNLLYEDTTFLVVDKPPMLPTQPDASNFYECCPACVDDILGPFVDISNTPSRRPLLCHRVDTCVGGCVVLSKDRNGQRVFQNMQRERQLRKMYLAVTTRPVPLGMHLHWMWAPQSARGKSGGPPCQLIRHTPPETRRKARVSRSLYCSCSVRCAAAV